MSDERLVTSPPNARGFYTPHEYVAICCVERVRTIPNGKNKGQKIKSLECNAAAAAILAIIERWTLSKLKALSRPPQPDDYWVWMSQAQFEEYELGKAYGESRIKTAIDLLISKGFVSRRNNEKKKFDRKYQYRFETEMVQAAIDALPPFMTIHEWIDEESWLGYMKPHDASMSSHEAIAHNPSQNTTQNDQESDPNPESVNPDLPDPNTENTADPPAPAIPDATGAEVIEAGDESGRQAGGQLKQKADDSVLENPYIAARANALGFGAGMSEVEGMPEIGSRRFAIRKFLSEYKIYEHIIDNACAMDPAHPESIIDFFAYCDAKEIDPGIEDRSKYIAWFVQHPKETAQDKCGYDPSWRWDTQGSDEPPQSLGPDEPEAEPPPTNEDTQIVTAVDDESLPDPAWWAESLSTPVLPESSVMYGDIHEHVLAGLEMTLGTAYQNWIDESHLLYRKGNMVVVGTAHEYAQQYCERQYTRAYENTLRTLTDDPTVIVKFVIEDDEIARCNQRGECTACGRYDTISDAGHCDGCAAIVERVGSLPPTEAELAADQEKIECEASQAQLELLSGGVALNDENEPELEAAG